MFVSNSKIMASNDVKICIDLPPLGLRKAFETLFTEEAVDFLEKIVTHFDEDIEQLHRKRLDTKCKLENKLPKFAKSPQRSDKKWKVAPLPKRLQNRCLDLGDVSPANSQHFIKALTADVQGVQVDFDDGHCPTWSNQIVGHHNIYRAVHGNLPGVGHIKTIPILMLRPRAWNMIDHNIIINGKKPFGTLVDFALLMFHNAQILTETNSGPFFYLSKLEGASEARLWNDIFIWTQKALQIPIGTIKACVLIENILSSFEMDEILYELKDHSMGLNCGIWDYAASIISKFGDRSEFVLPDRNKYVNMQRHFLSKYMELVVKTCHARGAHATGGMAALLVENSRLETIQKVVKAKRQEILAGVDGFMVYDLQLIPYINNLWKEEIGDELNQLQIIHNKIKITEGDLLEMPSGGVTIEGLKHNVEVAILFIYHWLKGTGHFYYKGAVEDSATAEISRSQIWQWIRHKAILEENGKIITKQLVETLTNQFLQQHNNTTLTTASELFLEIVTARFFPNFITTYLNDHLLFRQASSLTQFVLAKL